MFPRSARPGFALAVVVAVVVALALALVAATARPAPAQQTHTMICADRDRVVSQLRTRYGESVRSVGLAPQNRIVEVFASDEIGSWTITVTSADGTTCLMASGRYFESLPLRPQGDPL
jgi:hypothetical protein